jgi:hypothetical protein
MRSEGPVRPGKYTWLYQVEHRYAKGRRAGRRLVDLLLPGQLYGDRINVVDFRFSKILKLSSRTRAPIIAGLWKTNETRTDTSDENGRKCQGTCQKWVVYLFDTSCGKPCGKGTRFGQKLTQRRGKERFAPFQGVRSHQTPAASADVMFADHTPCPSPIPARPKSCKTTVSSPLLTLSPAV